MSAMANSSSAAETRSEFLLEVEAAGRTWGIPMSYVERVARLDGAQIDQQGGQPRIRVEGNELVLETLNEWGTGRSSAVSPGSQRLLELRHGEEKVAVLIDEVSGRTEAAVPVFDLPPLPFVRRPPMLGVFGSEADLKPVLDVAGLVQGAADAVSAADLPTKPAAPSRGAQTDTPSEPVLMRLPAVPWRGGAEKVVPVLSAAQVLGIEAAGSVLSLPALPGWCSGIGWWRERPVPVFDLQKRLSGTAAVGTEAQRWLLAAVPGMGTAALAISGSCSATPLPTEAAALPVPEELGQGIRGLFQVANERLALVDLQQWCRTDH